MGKAYPDRAKEKARKQRLRALRFSQTTRYRE